MLQCSNNSNSHSPGAKDTRMTNNSLCISPSEEVHRVWARLRQRYGRLPRRSEFNPRWMQGKTLRQMIVLKYTADGDLEVRLTGTIIDEIFGRHFARTSPLRIKNALARRNMVRFASDLRSGVLWGEVERSVGRHRNMDVTMYTRLFPFLGDGDAVAYLIGAIELDVAAYEAMGLNLRVNRFAHSYAQPRGIRLYPLDELKTPIEDYALRTDKESGNGLWTNMSRLA